MEVVCATSYHEILAEYSFPIEPLRDFELDGKPAQYVVGHPKVWGGEDGIIEFGEEVKGDPERAHYHSAVSSDGKLLAISANRERILVYDIGTKELRQVLEGTGPLAFRPSLSEEKGTANASQNEKKGIQAPEYILISSISDATLRGREDNKLILWDLDQCGRVLDEEERIDPSAFADKAIDAILPDLVANHEWSRDFVAASTLHSSFTKALREVASDHRRRDNTVFENVSIGTFNSEPFSHDGKFLLYLSQNSTTQNGMREPQSLPHVIVYDLDLGAEAHRLSGHTDAIMWTGFSPDDQHIASVSWDGTMRMYSASTGELAWTTVDSGGQSWCAAFSPDSTHIVWSSASGSVIQLHNVGNGKLVSKFAGKLKSWCRCFSWNPDSEQIAFCEGENAFVWRPFDGSTGTVAQHYQIEDENDWRLCSSVQQVTWMGAGRLLCLQMSDGSKLVYDTRTNGKELFQRSHGTKIGWQDFGLYGLFRGANDDEEVYLFVDEDGKLRFWRRGLALPPSSTHGREQDVVAVPQIEDSSALATESLGHGVPTENKPLVAGRDAWADSGAALWTAE